MSFTSEFEMRVYENTVELWLSTRLPFEPKGVLLDARNKLREAVRTLKADPGQILTAKYVSLGSSFCDVENVLFYNVGTAHFSQSARTGLAFNRVLSEPPQSPSGQAFAHYQLYSVGPPCDGPAGEPRALAFSCPLPKLSSSVKPHHVWWHASQCSCTATKPMAGEFELRVVVETPAPGSNVANYLKPLLDGLICGLHSESAVDQEAVNRLALATGWSNDEIIRRLTQPTAPILGPRRLLHSYREFVKWNPADHLCTRCSITTRKALTWSCSVELRPIGS